MPRAIQHNFFTAIALFGILFIASSAVTSAATKTWNGSSGSSWGTAANWTPSGVPTSNDDVVFSGNATVVLSTSGTTVKTLTISAGANVGLTTNGTLTVDGATPLGAGAELLLGGTPSQSIVFEGTVYLAGGNSASDPTRIYSNANPYKIVRFESTLSMGSVQFAYIGNYIIARVEDSTPFGSSVRFEGSVVFESTSNITLGGNATNGWHHLYLGKDAMVTVQADVISIGNGDGYIATGGGPTTPQSTIRRQYDGLGQEFLFPIGPPNERVSPIKIRVMNITANSGVTFSTPTGEPWPFISVRCLINGSGSSGGHPMNTANQRVWIYWPVKSGGISEPVYLDGYMDIHNNYRSGSQAYSARWTPAYEDVGSNGAWDLTGTGAASTSGSNRSIPFNGFPGFGDFNVGVGTAFGGDPVPVELTAFSARYKDGMVRLNWQTATEINNFGFAIERSRDGEGWEEVGFVPGFGNSSSPKNYAFEDALAGDLLRVPQLAYRLRQMDRDGTTDYSNIVFVRTGELPESTELYAAYPNPFNPTTTISFAIKNAANVTLKVYNTFGQEVATLLANSAMEAGLHTVPFSGEQLPSGVYMAVLEAGGALQQQKLVLNK